MAIRVNKDGTVVIERVLKVTKELETTNLCTFEDKFNYMMLNYSAEFKTALSKRLEACEEETTEAIRLLYHRGADALLDEEAHCITVYDVDDFNIDTVGKDFKLTICF